MLKHCLVLFILLTNSILFSIEVPEGLIIENKDDAAIIMTSSLTNRLIMVLTDKNVSLIWTFRFINNNILKYADYGVENQYDGDDLISLFTLPIIDIIEPTPSNLRYLIKKLLIEDVQKLKMPTIIIANIALQPYYLTEKDTEETKKLLKFYGDVCEEYGATFINPYNGQKETFSEVLSFIKEYKEYLVF